MSSLKSLAKQTFWYGASNIMSRFLNYLLTPLLTAVFASADYGKISSMFACAAFLNIIYTYGLETAYFRFVQVHPAKKVYNTALSSLWPTTILLTLILWVASPTIAEFLKLPDHPEYIQWIVLIVAIDALGTLPFSKLRQEGRPIKFATIKTLNILINIGIVVFFLYWCKNSDPGSFWSSFYDPSAEVGYVIIANLVASAVTLILLSKELFSYRWEFDKAFWKEMMRYSWPLLIVGFGGMVNEMIDRFMIVRMYAGSSTEAHSQVGIYSANYKLAILIVLFIQTFRMGAEPFFFNHAGKDEAPKIYARIMKFFVLACCCCFLGVTLFLDYWKYFMSKSHPEYWSGLLVVPVLMLAKLFLGIYYNLSVWYKVTNHNLKGAWITLTGVAVTVIVNFLLIPVLGYWACAIATVCCYGWMMVVSAIQGQRYYPVPYEWKRISIYILTCICLFLIHQWLLTINQESWFYILTAILLGASFLLLTLYLERKEWQQLPIGKKFFQR